MHAFYRRMDSVFKRFGSNRHRFCEKYQHNYHTLQTYWNTDKLPPGGVLHDIACEFNVSLDALVLGRLPTTTAGGRPILERVIERLQEKGDSDLLRIEGAIQMLEAFDRENRVSADAIEDEWAELEEIPAEGDGPVG